MAKQIFRQAALDRLASPEQTDRPHRLVRTPIWLAFAAAAGAIAAVFAWTLFAEAPVKVEGRGIVLPEEGLLEIVSDVEGRVEALSLKAGDVVRQGDVVATFSRSSLARDLGDARAELADARTRLSELRAFYERTEELERQAEEERLGTIRQTQAFADRRRQLMAAKIKSVRNLVDRKIVIRDRLIDAELQLAEARERLAGLDDEAKSIVLARLRRQNEQGLAIIDEQRKIERLAREAAKLERELSERRVIESAHTGEVVEVRVNRGDVLSRGAPIATLAPLDGGDRTLGVIYLAPADGKRVAVGMAVEAAPSTVRAEEHGAIVGEVIEVSSVPISLAGVRNTLKNDQLANELSAGSAPIEARIRFRRDPTTPSGLAWTSSRGPDRPVAPGTPLEAKVVVDRQRVIDLLAPGLGALVSGGDG